MFICINGRIPIALGPEGLPTAGKKEDGKDTKAGVGYMDNGILFCTISREWSSGIHNEVSTPNESCDNGTEFRFTSRKNSGIQNEISTSKVTQNGTEFRFTSRKNFSIQIEISTSKVTQNGTEFRFTYFFTEPF